MNFFSGIAKFIAEMRADMIRPRPVQAAKPEVSRDLIWDLEDEVSRLESARNRSASPVERKAYEDHIGALHALLGRHAPTQTPQEEPRP